MKFVVSVPGYSEGCGGSSALIELARQLHLRNHDSKVYLHDKHNAHLNPIYSNYFEGDRVDESTIVIYSEMDVGNRLHASRIVRLILYGAHMYSMYDTNELIYYHAPFCKNNLTRSFLTSCRLPPGLENKGIPRPNASAYAVKKGMRYPEIRHVFSDPSNMAAISGINVEGRSHAELVQIFNTTRYFYCYDPCCFLIIMALLCGCVVVQHPVPGYTEDEWRYTIGIGDIPGIAYGYGNLATAEATIHQAAARCHEFMAKNNATIDTFIRDMETGTRTYDKCYPFNESPYSLQHVMK